MKANTLPRVRISLSPPREKGTLRGAFFAWRRERAPRELCLAETQRRRELDIFCGKAEFGFAARRSASSLGRRRASEFSSRQRLEYLSSIIW